MVSQLGLRRFDEGLLIYTPGFDVDEGLRGYIPRKPWGHVTVSYATVSGLMRVYEASYQGLWRVYYTPQELALRVYRSWFRV